MTSRTVSGGSRGVSPGPGDDAPGLVGRVAQVGLEHQAGRGPLAELVLVQELEHEVQHRLAGVQGLHVDVQVRAGRLGGAQQRPQPPGGVALAALGGVGAQQRGQRRDLHAHVGARQRPDAVGLQRLARRPARGWRPTAARSPPGSGRRSGRPRSRSRWPRRAGRPSWPRRAPTACAASPAPRSGVSPTMKRWARWRTPPAAAAPSAARPARVPDIFIATEIGGGVSGTSSRKPMRWRARSSSDRHAGTTSTKRNSAARSSRSLEAISMARASSALQRLARGGGERGRQLLADLAHGALEFDPARARLADQPRPPRSCGHLAGGDGIRDRRGQRAALDLLPARRRGRARPPRRSRRR